MLNQKVKNGEFVKYVYATCLYCCITLMHVGYKQLGNTLCVTWHDAGKFLKICYKKEFHNFHYQGDIYEI